MMRSIIRLMIAVACCLALMGCGRSEPWDQEVVSQSLSTGRDIVAALEQWKTDHGGRAPKTLDELSRSGFVVKPPVAGTKKWIYGVREDGSYQLSFQVTDNYPCAYYDTRIGEWRVDHE